MSAAPAPRRCRPRRPDPGAPRPSDVVAVFFALGMAFLLAAALAGVLHAAAGWAPGRWLALHLAFVGGVSQLVLGASWFFVGAFLATGPPPRRLVVALLAAWNAAALLVAVGVSSHIGPLAVAGGVLVLIGLGTYALGLRAMQRVSLQRATWAVRWYYACACFLALGALAGILLAEGSAWPYGDLLGAHLALNVGGWFGTAIVGTLHTFYPSLTHTRLRFPRLQPATFGAWTAGIAALACGYAFGADAVAVAAWPMLLAAALLLAVNLGACTLAAPEALSLPARVVALGQIFLATALAVAVVVALGHDATAPVAGEHRAGMAVLLLAGWLGLTVLGSLLHLLTVLRRVRDLARPLPAPRPAVDRLVTALAAGGVGIFAAGRLLPLDAVVIPGALMLLAVYLLLAARILTTTGHVLARGGLRI